MRIPALLSPLFDFFDFFARFFAMAEQVSLKASKIYALRSCPRGSETI
jgi:hypothetical protein